MATTYDKIATQTVSGSSTNVITFSSIAASWTDLRLAIVFASTTNGQGQISMRYNSDSGTNYSRTHLTGNGSAASTQSVSNQSGIDIGNCVTTGSIITPPQFVSVDIFSYTGSTYKTSLMTAVNDTNNDPTYGRGGPLEQVALWRNTAAITSISLTLSTSNYSAGSIFTLYGIKAA